MFKHIEPWQPYHDFVHSSIGPADFVGLFREELQSLTHPEFREALYNYSNSQRPDNITQDTNYKLAVKRCSQAEAGGYTCRVFRPNLP